MRSLSGFIASLPVIVGRVSRAVARAVLQLASGAAHALLNALRGIARYVISLAGAVWSMYARIESQLVQVAVNLVLAIWSFRQLAALLLIAGALAWFQYWWFLLLYVALVAVAVFLYFRMTPEDEDKVKEEHKPLRAFLEKVMTWTTRIALSIVSTVALIFVLSPHTANLFSKLQSAPSQETRIATRPSTSPAPPSTGGGLAWSPHTKYSPPLHAPVPFPQISQPFNPVSPPASSVAAPTSTVITTGGFAGLKIGQSFEQAEKFFNRALVPVEGCQEPGWRMFEPKGSGVTVHILESQIVGFDVSSSAFATRSGLRVGDKEAKISELFGSDSSLERQILTEPYQRTEYWLGRASATSMRMIVVNGKVQTVIFGLSRSIGSIGQSC